MSSMDTMLAGVLKKALPPEVLELLTPEKIKEISEGINAYILNTRDSLARIEDSMSLLLQQQAALEERLGNVGRENSSGAFLVGSGSS